MRELISRLGMLASNRKTVLRRAKDGGAYVPCVTDEVPIAIDSDGSPVTLEPADWFVCFVPGLVTLPRPSESAIHYHVKSVVTAFLDSAGNGTQHDGSAPAWPPRERADKPFEVGQPMSTVATKDYTEIDYKDWGKGPAGAFSHGAGLPDTTKVRHLPASRSISIGAPGI